MQKQNLAAPLRLLMPPRERAQTMQTPEDQGAEPAPAEDLAGTRSGQNLEVVDFLVSSRRERADFLQRLADLYALEFQERVDPVPAVISFTSRKGILYDRDGRAYFAKQKPQYALEKQRLYDAARLQMTLSEHLAYVPPIIQTRQGQPYAQVYHATYFLTPYVAGDSYAGRRAQSLSAAYALGEMHTTARRLLPPAPVVADSREETRGFLALLARLVFPDQALQQTVMECMSEALCSLGPQDASLHGWLHGDFAPFNIVFHRESVRAVNDFDNVLYGPLSRDLAECVLTHCGVYYAGTTSSLRPPVVTTLDSERARGMVQAYLQGSGLPPQVYADMPSQVVCIWFELLALGLLRGDFSLQDVASALPSWSALHTHIREVLASV